MSQHLSLRAAAGTSMDDALYDRVARAASAVVIRNYSSSFGLASRLLRQPVRDHIRHVYALVRLADEVVDGSMAIERPQRARDLLDRLERDTIETLADGYSTDLVVHAFASSARACGIDESLVAPFFASMRTDLTVTQHDAASFEQYVYGSAEVVGLMCLRVFLAPAAGRTAGIATGPAPVGTWRPRTYDELAPGARRLGAAFQKVNFLRDLSADFLDRGRSYFPDLDPRLFCESDKHRLLDDIEADLVAAGGAMRGLPPTSRPAVTVAHAVFDELSTRLRATSADELMHRRVRLSSAAKTRVAVAALARERRR